MKEYLKMDDVFDLPIKESEIMWMVAHDSPDRLECAVHAINSHDDLVAEVERLRGALHDAATSLETIHIRSFGEESLLDSKPQMRSFAGARAKVAREALAE